MAVKKGGLKEGRGFESLFEDNAAPEKQTTELRISQIVPNRDQPRKNFDEQALAELSDSIRKHGLIQPLLVRPMDDGSYQIVAGERRWRASRMAGLERVPVVIREMNDNETMEIALIENLQREDLNPIEEALGYKTLMETFGMTQEQVASRVGKSRPAIANALRLLALSDKIRIWVADGSLSAGHARALLAISSTAKQEELAKQILENGLSVRQTELLVKKIQQESVPEKKKTAGVTVNYLDEVARKLTSRLGRKVTLVSGRKKGRIELEYYGNDDLEQLISQLEHLMSKR